ncbi:alpha/beta hydrolase fold domain-containing protein [Rhizobiales bacterium RZME27]|uniref:Alpha/beta hydrolase fold domain-containing protein n=1 Tax=Endobacterium cereale TaxID=2663029 RepID=A0A6A8A822_9HYPH|nr:alpha/beta hydrolase [Endobacterium cereale]MEB2845079.1 alpha/beta hydrolase [Endobacterium cereale]MQY44991.1 alpha/beta hydrolase fold domain-containing protein [Endobacterium cereale]
MIFHAVSDWDDAYANGPNIPDGGKWPQAWVEPARTYREKLTALGRAELDIAYGPKPRHLLDLFLPEGKPKGLVIYVHGGFWQNLDKSYWSHLANGAALHGYAVAMPQYTLCPDASISDITHEISAAITMVANRLDGPLQLTGHSAGGHLVARMVSATSPLEPHIRKRIRNTVSISGVHDLRPLLATRLNDKLQLTPGEADRESPALLSPGPDTRLFCWVGANERTEFVRQNDLLANVWTGLGAATGVYHEADRHHFNVVDGLADPEHPLTKTLLS